MDVEIRKTQPFWEQIVGNIGSASLGCVMLGIVG